MELVGLIGGIVGALGALVAAIFAAIGNKHSKNSAQAAQSSNGIAKDALAKASESNGIAQQANQLSEMANSIAQREFARNTEHVVIDLVPTWDKQQNGIVITNHGTDTAKDLVVLINGHDLTPLAETHAKLAGGEEFLIPVAEVGEVRKERVEMAMDFYGRSSEIAMMAASKFEMLLHVRLYFVTEAGNSQSGELADVIAR